MNIYDYNVCVNNEEIIEKYYEKFKPFFASKSFSDAKIREIMFQIPDENIVLDKELYMFPNSLCVNEEQNKFNAGYVLMYITEDEATDLYNKCWEIGINNEFIN